MTTGERIAALRKERSWNQQQLSDRLHVSQSTLAMWETDKRRPSTDGINDMADLFDVSADYLMGRSEKRHYYSLTEKDDRDVDQKIKDIMDGLDPDGPDFFKNDGNLSEHDKELLLVSLRQSYVLARELAKKKYTPKKYRGSETDD